MDLAQPAATGLRSARERVAQTLWFEGLGLLLVAPLKVQRAFAGADGRCELPLNSASKLTTFPSSTAGEPGRKTNGWFGLDHERLVASCTSPTNSSRMSSRNSTPVRVPAEL